jgi:hypothetical protein
MGSTSSRLIEDYWLIGDLESAALVSRDGTIDWLCLPRFDSASCFTALLGDERHGRWLLAPRDAATATSRRYRPGTLVLETDFETPDGAVRVIDFMPRRGRGAPRVMRIVEGLSGRVPMQMELSVRPDYGSIVPWVEPTADGALVTSGPDSFRLTTPLPVEVADGSVTCLFDAVEGARERLTLTWNLSFEESPPVEDADSALARTEAWWRERRHRRTHHVAPRGDRRGAQLGLPVLLAARLRPGARGAPRRGLHRGSGGVPRFPPQGGYRRSGEDPDHVRRRRRAAADRVRAGRAARL